MNQITIRQVEIKDVNDLAVLFEELSGWPSNINKLVEKIDKMKKSECHAFFVACDGERVVGTSVGYLLDDVCGECRPFLVIENVIVHSDYQGRGVGRMIFDALEEYARMKDTRYIMLASENKRGGAHHFYDKLGYYRAVAFKKKLDH